MSCTASYDTCITRETGGGGFALLCMPLSQVVLGLLVGANTQGQRAQTPIAMVMA
jgi:hypothetical protein